jgi:anti-anti-sigma factor
VTGSPDPPDLFSPEPFGIVVQGTVVQLRGEFDVACVPRFEAAVAPLRAGAGADAASVQVDLAGVVLLDSAALGALLRLRRDVVAAGGELVLDAPRPFQQRLLRIMGLEHLLGPDPRP